MKRIVLSFLAIMVLSMTLHADPVDADKAAQVARNFLRNAGTNTATLSDITQQTPFSEFYIFASNEGFVIVAGDDCVPPILAYSTSSQFHTDKMPPHIFDWLLSYEEQIAFYKQLYSSYEQSTRTDRNPVPLDARTAAAIANQWEGLTGGGITPPHNDAVSPLLSTTWNQSPYYNNMCPYDNNASDYTVTGCVATATAQIMKYFNHPTTGYGSHSYYHSTYGTISANFANTTYAWSSMPNALSASSSSAQVTAVATLMYHVGVAVDMDYSTVSSGASTTSNGTASDASAENALKNYFKYSPLIHSISLEDYSTTEWCNILKNELDNNRPILYSGRDTSGGHAFVLDGYNTSGQFHINWGWGSWCDGYYTIGNLHPASGGTGGNSSYTFNMRNHAVVGIQPNNNFGNSTTVTASTNNGTYGTVSGGGSFSLGDTVSLVATAASGCRLVQWSDGYKSARRQFVATGGTISLTAQFEMLSGDTLAYCSGAYISALGSGSTSTWGIKLPATVLTSGHDLQKVQLYVASAGTYNLTVYTGTSSPSTTASTVTYNATATNANQWNTITLPSAVSIDGTQSVWITFSCSDVSYPATMGYNSGNPDAMLWGSSFSSLSNSWNYSWLIRGIFEGTGSGSGDNPSDDTISYCSNNAYSSSIGLGNTTSTVYWGIRIPSSQLAGRNSVSSVQIYVPSNYGGTYTMNIYQGGTSAPQTLLHSQSYSFTSNLGDWQVCLPSSPVSISSSQDLWVIFANTDVTYPAAGCAYVNDNNSDWISLDGTTWAHCNSDYSLAYSWMIKCIVSSSMSSPSIIIQGPQQVVAGESATFTANATSGASISWSLQGATPATATGSTVNAIWNNSGTYQVVATATTTGGSSSDTLFVNVVSCNPITSYPYTMGFENDDNMACWHFVDNDNDGYGWMLQSIANTGSYSMGSASYINNIGALTPDNWMILPQMQFTAGNNYQLSWYTGIIDVNYYQEQYGIYVSTTGISPADFTLVQQYTIDDTNWTLKTLDLSNFAGQNVYIAFRHYGTTDVYWMLIDDIVVSEQQNNSDMYNVAFSCTGNGSGIITAVELNTTTLCGLNIDVSDGNSLTLIVTPDNCAFLEHLYLNNVDIIDQMGHDIDNNDIRTYTLIPTANTSVQAVFTKYSFSITASAEPSYMGHVDGTGPVNCGSTATLTAVPEADNYRFVRWNDNITDNPRVVTATEDKHFTAFFEATDGIDDSHLLNSDFSIFPNPSSGEVTIRLSAPSTVIISDINGRTCFKANLQVGSRRISALETGIYIVQITTDNTIQTTKLVVK